MAAGLLQEAIMARGRRELASENGYDEVIPPPATRTRRGRSQNSRYENDLGNIASFDRPPVKPKFAPRTNTVGSGDRTVASVNFTKYKYGGDPQDHVEIGGGKEQGGGGEGGVWRKLQAPEPKESLDPNLESILFPKTKPPPHSSSDSFFLKTPSSPHPPAPGPAMRNGSHYDKAPAIEFSSHHAGRPEYQPEETGFFQEHSGRLYSQAKQGVGRPTPSRNMPPQGTDYDVQHGDAPPHPSDPPPPSHHPYNALPNWTPHHAQQNAAAPAVNGRYRQPPPRMPSFTPRMAPSYPPPQPNAYPPPIIPYPQPYPTYNPYPNQYPSTHSSAPQRGAYIPPIPSYPPPNALMDPSTQPIPVYDHTIRQWVLVPAAPLLPQITHSTQAMSLSSASRHRSLSRPTGAHSPGQIPEALEEAFQHLDTPTRPRRAPSGVDMRAKKTGKALIRSLETQVEEASSSADELNLRPAYEERERVQRRVNEVADDSDFFNDDDTSHTPPAKPKSSRTITKPSAPPRRHDHAQPVDYDQSRYDLTSQDESEDLPPQHYHQPHGQSRRPHGRHHIQQEGRHHRSKQNRKRARVDHHSSEPSRPHRLHHSPPHHRHSLPPRHIKASHSLPPSRHSIPSHRRLRREHPTRSPSDTETDSGSDAYESPSEPGSDDGSFTSPSNTPSSPTPEADPRMPLTAGAWAGYEIPDHLVHSETLPHPKRSRSKRVKSVPLLPHQRPRDAHGKWLPYAYTRSESPEGDRAEMEVEEEPEEEGEREDIEAFSSPSQEDRGRAEREEMDIEENGEEMPPLPATKRGRKKSVRWDKGVKEHDAGRKGVNRLPKGWNVEVGQGEDAGEQEGGGDERRADAGVEEGEDGKGDGGGVSPFGEGFFDATTAGEVGFKVWRDEY